MQSLLGWPKHCRSSRTRGCHRRAECCHCRARCCCSRSAPDLYMVKGVVTFTNFSGPLRRVHLPPICVWACHLLYCLLVHIIPWCPTDWKPWRHWSGSWWRNFVCGIFGVLTSCPVSVARIKLRPLTIAHRLLSTGVHPASPVTHKMIVVQVVL